MSKKLKKKIEEICGLKDLAWEVRQARATQILESSEWKQSICNELIGLSFRELEQTLSGVASERQKKEDSYERKLKAYQAGKANKQRNVPKSNSTSSTKTPRSLEEILAQVYAPRVVSTWGSNKNLPSAHALRTVESSDEIPSDSTNRNDIAEE